MKYFCNLLLIFNLSVQSQGIKAQSLSGQSLTCSPKGQLSTQKYILSQGYFNRVAYTIFSVLYTVFFSYHAVCNAFNAVKNTHYAIQNGLYAFLNISYAIKNGIYADEKLFLRNANN